MRSPFAVSQISDNYIQRDLFQCHTGGIVPLLPVPTLFYVQGFSMHRAAAGEFADKSSFCRKGQISLPRSKGDIEK